MRNKPNRSCTQGGALLYQKDWSEMGVRERRGWVNRQRESGDTYQDRQGGEPLSHRQVSPVIQFVLGPQSLPKVGATEGQT